MIINNDIYYFRKKNLYYVVEIWKLHVQNISVKNSGTKEKNRLAVMYKRM